MKYLTKAWYETCQNTGWHLLLKVSKKAETFSEDYFRSLYKKAEKEQFELEQEASEISFDEIFPEEMPMVGLENYHLDTWQIDDMKARYAARREQAYQEFINRPPFSPEQCSKEFRASHRNNIKDLKESLPESILEQVADIRVLALNYASSEVKKSIRQFCIQNEKAMNAAMAAYKKYFSKTFKNDPPEFITQLVLHDCIVLSCRKQGKDIVMTVDNSGGFTDIHKIRMKNCNVIKQDAPLHGARCLYEEVYKAGDQYELHFLMEKTRLIDYIVTVDYLEYE